MASVTVYTVMSKVFLKKKPLSKYPDKLASEVDTKHLIQNWDKSGLSWSNIAVLDCILPNKYEASVIINAMKFFFWSIEHWKCVHGWKL